MEWSSLNDDFYSEIEVHNLNKNLPQASNTGFTLNDIIYVIAISLNLWLIKKNQEIFLHSLKNSDLKYITVIT